MLKIAITGNIGAGKSALANEFFKLGYPVLDADKLSREITNKTLPDLVKLFGAGILNNDRGLDRSKLRELVFQDASNRQKLESLLHPKIAEESRRLLLQLEDKGSKAAFYEATLIFETGREKEFDKIIAVIAEDATRIKRILKRNPAIDEKTALLMLQSQMDQNQKAAKADWTVKNNGAIEGLEAEAKRILKNMNL